MIQAFKRLDLDDAVKVVVLTSTPNSRSIFCAGADLSKGNFSSSNRYTAQASHNSARNLNEHRDGGGQTSLSLLGVRKPTICAINGSAVGIGITMTLSADIRIAWKDAKIGFVFARRGIVPEAASSYFLPRLIGHSKALELCMVRLVLYSDYLTVTYRLFIDWKNSTRFLKTSRVTFLILRSYSRRYC